MLKHKILIQKKNVELSSKAACCLGKIEIVAYFPFKSTLEYKTDMLENRPDVVEEQCDEIEKILKQALDDIEEMIIKKEKEHAKN